MCLWMNFYIRACSHACESGFCCAHGLIFLRQRVTVLFISVTQTNKPGQSQSKLGNQCRTF